MELIIAICKIAYLLWPLILLLGIKKLFQKKVPFTDRLKLSIQRIFLGWIFMAISLGVLYWTNRQPILIFPQKTNYILFGVVGLITGSITFLLLIRQWNSDRILLRNAKTLEGLLALSPMEFEKLVATLFKANGYQAQVLGGSSDHGIDILVLSDQNEKWIVQCKRYRGSVGEPVVRDLFGAMGHEVAQKAYLITTGSFTTQAQEWAAGKPIVLYDGPSLVKLVKSTKLHRSQLRI